MNDEKLKVVVAVLGGIVFGLIFVMLAFVLPIQEPKETAAKKAPTSHLEKISHEVEGNSK